MRREVTSELRRNTGSDVRTFFIPLAVSSLEVKLLYDVTGLGVLARSWSIDYLV